MQLTSRQISPRLRRMLRQCWQRLSERDLDQIVNRKSLLAALRRRYTRPVVEIEQEIDQFFRTVFAGGALRPALTPS
ncbi:hypothetical protein [Rivihabitans pingtungensis]|jgi:hypothetical protein|uniref:Uncharacterized protein n=1 Tax=Rivihabitans pingtungensis TaxID=1054498 RepID=A0A318LFD5_9NEIS|nr:hypothetical protein [Rivihabitans pingtungensis]PXX80327.1 hypothetical protein DFR34_104102 [Rivihabitans pingtungensis]HNX72118.1 hypothetical protein [Rivihabitans pingtungensis]